MTRLRVGACLSLSGRYARFGRQAAAGLRTWQGLTEHELELRVEDDNSDPSRVADAVKRAAANSDILLGPYSTQLMREAGRAIEDIDALLWNHGGSGDNVQALCPGRIVSILAPTSRYAEPFVRARAAQDLRAKLWVIRGRGQFARQVAAGALRAAEQLDLEATERNADEEGWLDAPSEPWDLFSVGTFEADVEIVKAARSAPSPPRALCCVAGGVRDFASSVEPDGIYGIAQWFPGRNEQPDLGPTETEFVDAYRATTGSLPDYPAVQACAAAVLAAHCVELAGSTEPAALWETAGHLGASTLFGPFGIDADTGTQIRHAPVLLKWRGRELQLAQGV